VGRENAEAISAGAAKSYEDVIRSFGGRFVGESQVLPGHIHPTGSTDDGVKDQS
jgi:hypothetical protein